MRNKQWNLFTVTRTLNYDTKILLTVVIRQLLFPIVGPSYDPHNIFSRRFESLLNHNALKMM